jgi:DHA2 family multidrug resistance protein-like MFS transporter
VPPEAAAAARDTLGAAAGAAEQLPPSLGTALLDASREAFIQGMRVSTAVATVVAIGISVLAVTMLRQVGSGSDREDAKETEAIHEGESRDRVVAVE